MAKQNKGEKSAYRVLTPLRHDLKHYDKGATVQLSDEDAKPLLARKVVTPFVAKETAAE